MIKRIFQLLVVLLIAAAANASETSLEELANKVRQLDDIYQRGEQADYALTPKAEELCADLAQITMVNEGARTYYVDLWWVNTLAGTLKSETVPKKRRLIFANFVDTLNGLVLDLNARVEKNGATRKQMLEALDRAMGRTRVVKVAKGQSPGTAIEWAGGGSFVIDGSGEGISVISGSVDSSKGAYSRVGQFNGAGASVGYHGSGSGYGSGSGSRSSSNSGAFTGGSVANAVSNSTGKIHGNVAAGGSSSSSHTTSTSVTKSYKTYKENSASNPVNRQSRVKHTPAPPKPQQPKPQPPKPTPPKPPKLPKTPTKLANYIFYVILGICILALLIMIYFMVRNARKKMAREQEEFASLEASLPPERMKVETIYDKALQAAAQGDFAEGIRLLTIGALLLLEQRRVMNFQDTLTNGEYLRSLLQERHLHSMFREPMNLFDLLIYGFRKPGQTDFERFRKFYLELEKVHQ